MTQQPMTAAGELRALEECVTQLRAEAEPMRQRLGELEMQLANIVLSGFGSADAKNLRIEKTRVLAQLGELEAAFDVARIKRIDLTRRITDQQNAQLAQAHYDEKLAIADVLPQITEHLQAFIALVAGAASTSLERDSAFKLIGAAARESIHASVTGVTPRRTLAEALADLAAKYRQQAQPAKPAALKSRKPLDTAVHTRVALRYHDSADPGQGERTLPSNWLGCIPARIASRATALGLAQILASPPLGKRRVSAAAQVQLPDGRKYPQGFVGLIDADVADPLIENGTLHAHEIMLEVEIAGFRNQYPGEPVRGFGGTDLGDVQDEDWLPPLAAPRPMSEAAQTYARADAS